MKYSSICFTFAIGVILWETTWSQTQNVNSHNQECTQLAKTDWICFKDNTLGVCMQVAANSWQGLEVIKCPKPLCCDVKSMGCMINCVDGVGCAYGDLRKDDADSTCTKYFYCSNSKWAGPATCPYGVFDEAQKSCVLGPCRQ